MSDIFIRSGTLQVAQRRILLAGDPGEGKTFTACTTSPNPRVADIDKGITDPRLVKMDFPIYPFYDLGWNEKTFKKKNVCYAIMEFLKGPAKELTITDTLVIDSMSSLQDEMHKVMWAITPIPKGAQTQDVFAFWDLVKDYWNDFFTQLTYLNCHVIMTAHLAPSFNKDFPNVVDCMRPLIDGSTKSFVGRFFTDVIRQVATSKAEGSGDNKKYITEYKWQVKPDNMFKAKSRANVDTMYIPASFNKLIEVN